MTSKPVPEGAIDPYRSDPKGADRGGRAWYNTIKGYELFRRVVHGEMAKGTLE